VEFIEEGEGEVSEVIIEVIVVRWKGNPYYEPRYAGARR